MKGVIVMKILKSIFLLIFLSFIFTACNKADTNKEPENSTNQSELEVNSEAHLISEIPLLNIEGISWTTEEIDYINELNKKGSIRIATKISATVYKPQSDGTVKGFHYSVLKEFTDLVEVEIDTQLVTWDDYFYKEGEDVEKAKNDPNYSYVPTLIDNVDLYIDGVTSLPWREKLFDIIKFVPSKQLIVSRLDNIPLQIADLNNKTCYIVRDTSIELNLDELQEEENINIDYIYVDSFDNLAKMVSEGEADFTVSDSDAAFNSLYTYENLTIAMPVSEVQVMGWGVNKKNKVLNNILTKYLHYAQEVGILDIYWKESYGVTFIDYLSVLELE
jgi:membrane-bound lytic murein transglycosylase MltF